MVKSRLEGKRQGELGADFTMLELPSMESVHEPHTQLLDALKTARSPFSTITTTTTSKSIKMVWNYYERALLDMLTRLYRRLLQPAVRSRRRSGPKERVSSPRSSITILSTLICLTCS